MKRDAIAIKNSDNVATAIRNIEAGQEVLVGIGETVLSMTVIQEIPYGHKLAISDIKKGDNIFKYAAVIGRATQDIQKGMHVHVQNVESLRGRGDL